MSITLQRELEQIEANIKSSIISGDNFEYQKLLRVKQETTDKLFFAETKSLREAIDSHESERSFNLSLRADLQAELTAAAEVVADIHKRLVAAQKIHEGVKLRAYFNDVNIEQQRKDIRDLQRKLDAHVSSKLNSGDSPTNEVFTNEDTH